MLTKIEVKPVCYKAVVPTKAHGDDAAFDLHASEDGCIWPDQVIPIPTGVAFSIPPGYVGIIYGRSSWGKRNCDVIAGVIDAGYQGEVKVLIQNGSGHEQHYREGDRIAQIIFHKLPEICLTPVDEFAAVTERGENGFGSTGE